MIYNDHACKTIHNHTGWKITMDKGSFNVTDQQLIGKAGRPIQCMRSV